MFDRREILLLLQAMQEKRSKAAVRDHCVPPTCPAALATAGSCCRFELCVACHVLEILQGEGDPQKFILRFSQVWIMDSYGFMTLQQSWWLMLQENIAVLASTLTT